MAKSDFSIFEQQIAANVAAWKAKRKTMGRAVKEWIGKTADAAPPEPIRQRILDTWDCVCYLSEIQIDRAKGFDVEHPVTVKDGGVGANREGNMRPALRDPHILKTAREKRHRAKADRQKRAASGTKAAPKKELNGQEFQASKPQCNASADLEKGKLGEMRALTGGGLARRFVNG
ncbi:MAG: hypothetical protein Q8M31_21940 [Beijerinckiaceae bacterium]|nr:hypothetical protein [Beijerinckiaceae bacterium]